MSRSKGPHTDPVEARLDEIARLLALLLAKDSSLQDTIAHLSTAGLGPTRIAELLGTTPAYANLAATRARKKGSKTKAKAAKRRNG